MTRPTLFYLGDYEMSRRYVLENTYSGEKRYVDTYAQALEFIDRIKQFPEVTDLEEEMRGPCGIHATQIIQGAISDADLYERETDNALFEISAGCSFFDRLRSGVRRFHLFRNLLVILCDPEDKHDLEWFRQQARKVVNEPLPEEK